MRKDGLTNAQIGERYGLEPHTVGARVSYHRKSHNLPLIKRKKNGFHQSTIDDANIRSKNHEEAYRDKDGKLICPIKTCEGFGFNSLMYDLGNQ